MDGAKSTYRQTVNRASLTSVCASPPLYILSLKRKQYQGSIGWERAGVRSKTFCWLETCQSSEPLPIYKPYLIINFKYIGPSFNKMLTMVFEKRR